MEALFILLGELIAVPLTLCFTLVAEAFLALAAAIASLLESVFGISISFLRKKESGILTPEQREAIRVKSQQRSKFMKRLSWALGVILVLMLAVVCLVNFVFFESSLRWALSHVERRTGIKVTFTSASGSLFSGALTLQGVTAQRQGHTNSNFNLQAAELALDLPMTRILKRTTPIEKVFLTGLKGEFHRVKTPEHVKLRKHYNVDHLRLKDAEVVVRDTSRPKEAQFTVKIDELDSQPLRSRFAVFDVLFRSSVSGELAGRPFSIQTRKTESGRETDWQANDLPVALVAHHLGGPFDWLEGGTVDVRVKDKWGIDSKAQIDMQWSFVLKQMVVNPPNDNSAGGRLLAAAVSQYLQEHAEKLDVSFSLKLDENQFDGAASADAAGLGTAIRVGFARELAQLTGIGADKLDQGIKKGIEFFKEHLNNRRKKAP